MTVSEISAEDAFALLERGEATFVDVRDLGSWRRGHVPGAAHVGDHNIREFVAEADRERTTVVYCFHGNSSKGGAAYLGGEGFTDVHSMAGGFAAWHGKPTEEAPLPDPPATPRPARAAPAPAPAPGRERPSRRRRWLNRLRSLSRK